MGCDSFQSMTEPMSCYGKVTVYDFNSVTKKKSRDGVFVPGQLRRGNEQVVWKMWKQDFLCSECRLSHHSPEEFTRSFWQSSKNVSPAWLLYRIAIAIHCGVTWIISFLHIGREVKEEDAIKYPIFLTNWTYTLQTWHFFLGVFIVFERLLQEKRNDSNGKEPVPKMPWWYQLYWVLHTTLISASICVTLIFWGAVYDPNRDPLDIINIATHVLNSIIMVIDFFLVSHPFRIAHIYWPTVYALIYLLFSVVYQFSGGTGTDGKVPIYTILDWEKPGEAVLTCVLAQMLLMLIHVTFWLFYRAKVAVKNKCCESSRGKLEKEGIENYGMDLRIV